MTQIHESMHPLVKHKVTLLRDRNTDIKKFRELVQEITALLTYEITTDLVLVEETVTTPLAPCKGHRLKDIVGLIPILRAGLCMVEGVWELIPNAQVWHIGLYRDEKTLKPVEYYNKLPQEPTVTASLVLDPMLATGGSAIATVDLLKKWKVKNIKYMGLIGAPEGIKAFSQAHPDVPVYIAAIDEKLNEYGYIVPGLGDAGDRLFGTA